MDDDTIANLPTGAGASPPAYVRKQAAQPKPLAAGFFGARGIQVDAGLTLAVVSGLIILLLFGMGVVNAHAGASQVNQIASSQTATATATAAGHLPV